MDDDAVYSHVQRNVWQALRVAGVRLDTPGAVEVARALAWIVSQQPMILTRFPTQQNDAHTQEGFAPDAYWPIKFTKFLHRADLLTLDSPEGRQAIAEFAATAVGLLASTWRLHGSPASEGLVYRNGHELLVVKNE